MKTPRILVIGSSNTDMIVRLDRIPLPGETVLGGNFMMAAGGKGANQAVAAARAGARVTFIARVGADSFGEQAIAGFEKDGIDTTRIIRDPEVVSGVALIFVAKNGENSIAVASGANGKLSPADIAHAQETFAGASALVMQLETPLETIQAAAEQAKALGIPVILNPAPAQPLPAELLRNVSILTPNETEAQWLTGIEVNGVESAAEAAGKLMAQGVKTVIITLGAQGAFVADATGYRLVTGFKVSAVDTTAAGDTFNGALSVALSEGYPLDQAVRFANAAAALSVTRKGAQPSVPSRAEIEKFLAAH